MTIEDIVNLAKYSELAGVAAKNDINAIVAFINLGMVELYTRFPIKVKEVVVALSDSTVYHEMPKDFMYALQAFGETPKESLFTSMPLAINDEYDPLSIFFNDWNTVQIPASVTGAFVSILYVTKATSITKAEALDGVTEILLPDGLIDCLLSYIGYRAHMGVKSDSRSENNAHLERFERNCRKAEELGVAVPSESMVMGQRIFNRGFV
jgi:hypothetical protein